MKYSRHWGIPDEQLRDASSRIRPPDSWVTTASLWAQAISIPILAGLLLFSR
mgnify:CR=1 FL=1